MSAFQFIGVGVCAVAAGWSLSAAVIPGSRAAGRRAAAVAWSAVWGAAGLAILMPERVTIAARAVGIGRGADAVLYVVVLAVLMGFWRVAAWLHRLRREITKLVRFVALLEARSGREPGAQMTGPAGHLGAPAAPAETDYEALAGSGTLAEAQGGKGELT